MRRVSRSNQLSRVVESLERRRLLSGSIQPVVDGVSSTLAGLNSAMSGISNAVSVLPVIGKSANDIDEIRNSINSVTTPVMSVLNAVNNIDSLVESVIRSTVFTGLSSAGILRDNSGSNGIDLADVIVNFAGLNDFSIEFGLKKSFSTDIPTDQLSIGLSSVPLGIRAAGNGSLNVSFEYKRLRFGRDAGGFFFDTSFNRELQFTVGARLPQSMTVLLGVLMGTATNNTAGDNFIGTITADVNGLSVQTPRLGGSANFNLGIETAGIGITAELLPKIKTDLVLSWPFGSANAGGPESSGTDLLGAYGQFGTPSLAFNNLSFGLGPMLSQIIKPIAGTLSSVTRPLQDALDKLYSPIPGLTDLSNFVGGPDITLTEVAAFNGLLPPGPAKLPAEFDNFVNVTSKLRQFTRIINDLASAGSLASAFVNLGNFPISGPSGGSLLVNALGQQLFNRLGGALDVDWSDLLALGENLTFDEIVARSIDKAIEVAGQVAGDEVADVLTQLRDQLIPANPTGVKFEYPIIEDTKGQLVGALLGKEIEFVEMTVRWTEDYGDPIALPPLPFLPQLVQITPSMNPEIDFRVGLDSYGLKKAIVAATNSNIDPLSAFAVHAPSGIYVMSDSRFNLDASMSVAAGVGFPGFFVGAGGGLSANLLVQMDVPNPNQVRKIRVFDPESEPNSSLGSSIFRVSGNVRAFANVTTTVGIDPFSVTVSKNWAEATLFSFDTYPKAADNIGRISNPFVAQGPPTLARFESPGVLTLLAGSEPRRTARAVAVGDVNERFLVSQYVNESNQRVTVVNAYGLEQEFLNVSSIYVEADDGNDIITVDKSVQVLAIVQGGSGNDQITVNSTVEMQLFGGPGDDTLKAQTGSDDVVMLGEAGNDSLYVRSGTSSNAARSIALFGGDNDDEITVGGVYPSNVSVSVNGGTGADRMTVTVTGKPFLLAWPAPQDVTVTGGPVTDGGDVVIWRDLPALNTTQLVPVPLIADHSFLVTDSSIIRNTSSAYARVNYGNVARVELNSHAGNDSLLVTASNRDITMRMGEGDDRFINAGTNNVYRIYGDGGDDLFNIWGGQAFKPQGVNQLFGGAGIDSIEYDVNSPGNTSSTWQVSNGLVSIRVNGSPLASISTDGWEGVRFTGTSGADSVAVFDSIPFNLFINTLGGDDLVTLVNARNPFQVQINNNIGVDLGGQSGDTLTAYTTGDQNRFVLNPSGYNASRDGDLALINTLRVGPVAGVGLFNLITDNPDDVIDIDASGDPFRRYNIDSFSGNDQITLRNFGDLIFDSTINGGAGADTLTFDDSARTTGLGYVVTGDSIYVPLGEFFGAFHTTPGFSQINVKTGSGNDDVQFGNFATGGALSIETGAGNDTVRNQLLFNAGGPPFYWGNLQSALVSISSFNWDGGPGTDLFGIDNTANNGNWQWDLRPGSFSAQRPGIYGVTLGHTNAEGYSFLGGTGADIVNVPATDIGDVISLNAGAGDDTYNAYDVFTRRTDSIQSLITINDTSGNDALVADNAGKPDTGGLGDWLHITEGVLSHTTNDRFFAPGGRVVHSGINNIGVVTSQANDYVIVAPSAAYTVQISDSSIVSSTQDNVNYSLAGVIDPLLMDIVFGKRLNSSNRQIVTAYGFEFHYTGDEVPAVTTPPAPVFDAPAFYVNVGFDVPMDVYTFGSGEAFTVQNLTTGQTLPVGSMLAADNGVNGFFITFPGYANGLPPDGRYRITLNGDYVRSVNYNPMGADQTFDFTVLRGDANNDAAVDFDDLLVLAANYNQSGRSFSQGDSTYDGVVNFDDLLLLASRYNQSLPLAGSPAPLAMHGVAGDRFPGPEDDHDRVPPLAGVL